MAELLEVFEKLGRYSGGGPPQGLVKVPIPEVGQGSSHVTAHSPRGSEGSEGREVVVGVGTPSGGAYREDGSKSSGTGL